MTFGAWLRARREAVNLPTLRALQEQLEVAQVHVSLAALSQWELDKARPTDGNRAALWTVLGVHGELRRQVEIAFHGLGDFPPVRGGVAA